MKTGFLSHELYMWHDTGTAALFLQPGLVIEPDEHAESAKTKRRMRSLLDVSGLLGKLQLLNPFPASVEDITRFHTPDYVRRIKELSDNRGGDAGELTPFGPGGYEIALLSAGGVINTLEAVWTRKVKNAYALVRPPGHHAEADRGRGFCIFGNVAIGAMKLLAEYGAKRIAIIDWDVHHGNGTQSAFYQRNDVLMMSIHQDNLYPAASGSISEIGSGEGKGYTINVPLPPGSGVGAYEYTFNKIILPALELYRPEMIIVSSGFDAGAVDPLGRMMMYSEGYRTLTKMLMEAADALCEGRLALVHEGGYSPSMVPFCGLAVMEQLSGERTEVRDPFIDVVRNYGYQDLQDHQKDIIDIASKNIGQLR